jgi:hypothetical protein
MYLKEDKKMAKSAREKNLHKKKLIKEVKKRNKK